MTLVDFLIQPEREGEFVLSHPLLIRTVDLKELARMQFPWLGLIQIGKCNPPFTPSSSGSYSFPSLVDDSVRIVVDILNLLNVIDKEVAIPRALLNVYLCVIAACPRNIRYV